MSDKLSAMLAPALAYAERKFYVFPITARAKKPPLTKNGFKDATTDPTIVKRWWMQWPDANIGISCAASRIVVIDVDVPGPEHKQDGRPTLAALVDELGPLPETVEAVTAGGGRHLVFAVPAGLDLVGSLGPGVDIKHQGYILAAPSINSSGGDYRWIRSPLDQMPAPLPTAWLARMVKLTAPKVADPPRTTTSSGCTPYGLKAKRDELETLQATAERRNIATNDTALKLARLHAGGEIDDCREEIFAAAAATGLVAEDGEHSVRATIESGWRKGMSEPRMAPARDSKTAITPKTSTANSTTAIWPDSQPLVADVEQLPYPADALPALFRAAVGEVQGFVQAPVAMVAMSALGAASLAVQGLANVQRAEGLAGPVSLFLLALAPSGERKSTIDNRFGAPIREYEIAQKEKGEPLLTDYKADLASWSAQQQGLQAKIQKATREGKDTSAERERMRELVAGEPKSPRIPSLIHNDSTMEGLGWKLAKVWPSACIQSSEAGSVFGAHTMGKETLMRTLSLWNTLWDGGAFRIERRSIDGSYWVKGARLTMSLQAQPGMFLDYLESDRGLSRDSGFLARTLIACPQSTQGTRRFREPPTSWPALARFCNRIAALLNESPRIDDDGALNPALLTMSSEAKRAWIQFHDRIEDELKVGGSLCDVKDVASKIADNACRMAAIFQVVEHGLGAVGLPAFEAAARIVEWHLNESRRFFGQIATPKEDTEAAALDMWIGEYCRARGASSIPVSTIQKSGPAKVRVKAALESALATLQDLGRARLVKGEGKARIVEINPSLLAVEVIAVPAVIAQPAKKAVV